MLVNNYQRALSGRTSLRQLLNGIYSTSFFFVRFV